MFEKARLSAGKEIPNEMKSITKDQTILTAVIWRLFLESFSLSRWRLDKQRLGQRRITLHARRKSRLERKKAYMFSVTSPHTENNNVTVPEDEWYSHLVNAR